MQSTKELDIGEIYTEIKADGTTEDYQVKSKDIKDDGSAIVICLSK